MDPEAGVSVKGGRCQEGDGANVGLHKGRVRGQGTLFSLKHGPH